MNVESSPEPPKNKILIAFKNGDADYQKSLVSQLIGIDISYGDRIVKNLAWKTKYYSVGYDLYIDDYEQFGNWFQELNGKEFSELREVIAVLVIVDEYKSETRLNTAGFQDSSVVWVNTDPQLDQENVNGINDKLIQSQDNNVELVNLHSSEETNEYGEKIGIPRFREIVDTCPWRNCDAKYFSSTTAGGGGGTNSEVSLELIVQRMQHARLKHTNSELNSEEAMQIAQEIAEELMDNEV